MLKGPRPGAFQRRARLEADPIAGIEVLPLGHFPADGAACPGEAQVIEAPQPVKNTSQPREKRLARASRPDRPRLQANDADVQGSEISEPLLRAGDCPIGGTASRGRVSRL